MKTRLLILALALIVFAAPAMAEQRTAGGGVPNITHSTPTTVPGGIGGVPQQNVPQNSATQSAGEQQKKLQEIQRRAHCQSECKRVATTAANYAWPTCQNNMCPPSSPFKKKWEDKFNFVQTQCRKQQKCE